MSFRFPLFGLGLLLVSALVVSPVFADNGSESFQPDRSVERDSDEDADDDDADGDADAEEAQEGADSPEAAFKTFKEGFRDSDYGKVLGVMTLEFRAEFTFAMVGMGMMIAAFAEFEDDEDYVAHAREFGKILERHEFDPEAADAETDELELYRGLKDPAALLTDVMNWLDGIPGEDDEESFSDMFGELTLSDVEIDGDDASGSITDGDGDTSPINFRKIDDRWYVSGAE